MIKYEWVSGNGWKVKGLVDVLLMWMFIQQHQSEYLVLNISVTLSCAKCLLDAVFDVAQDSSEMSMATFGESDMGAASKLKSPTA